MPPSDVQVHHVFVHADRELLQRLDSIDQTMMTIHEMLKEVLDSRQATVDALSERLETQQQTLQEVVDRVGSDHPSNS
jgi:hypothetical protein